MSKVLTLYNTFTRKFKPVSLAGKQITANTVLNNEPIVASLYVCGPTVYSDCHLGHAITYIRADLFRRFLRSILNVRLDTVMNITDVDDKILENTRRELGNHELASDPSSHPFNAFSDRYYKLFLKDMESIRVLPADLYLKVSRSIHLITKFIQQLERNNCAYRSTSGDILFRVNSVRNYKGRIDPRKGDHLDEGKEDQRDFVLWKRAKPGEPSWLCESARADGRSLLGRPGWHVQCSAISSAMFGSKLDFHYGGKDLIFPHHYNEEACSCAYHSLDTSSSLHVWASHWLHSGHLVIRDSKMSKSLGNVVPIKNFINRASVNALRLLCISTHYRADLVYSEDVLQEMKALDHKINAFVDFLKLQLSKTQDFLPQGVEGSSSSVDIRAATELARHEVVDGLCDDLDLSRGLKAIIDLSKRYYSVGNLQLSPRDLLASWSLLSDWCSICALEYAQLNPSSGILESSLIEMLTDFRQSVRTWTLNEMKEHESDSFNDLLDQCDSVRKKLNELGFVSRDMKSRK